MKKLFVSVDKKYKTEEVIACQIKQAVEESKKQVGDKVELIEDLEKADCAWFVDEWEDDIGCYKDHEYCLKNGVKILHDKSEFWNRT